MILSFPGKAQSSGSEKTAEIRQGDERRERGGMTGH